MLLLLGAALAPSLRRCPCSAHIVGSSIGDSECLSRIHQYSLRRTANDFQKRGACWFHCCSVTSTVARNGLHRCGAAPAARANQHGRPGRVHGPQARRSRACMRAINEQKRMEVARLKNGCRFHSNCDRKRVFIPRERRISKPCSASLVHPWVCEARCRTYSRGNICTSSGLYSSDVRITELNLRVWAMTLLDTWSLTRSAPAVAGGSASPSEGRLHGWQ